MIRPPHRAVRGRRGWGQSGCLRACACRGSPAGHRHQTSSSQPRPWPSPIASLQLYPSRIHLKQNGSSSASRAASPRVGSGAMTSYRKLADGTLGHETLHVVSPWETHSSHTKSSLRSLKTSKETGLLSFNSRVPSLFDHGISPPIFPLIPFNSWWNSHLRKHQDKAVATTEIE